MRRRAGAAGAGTVVAWAVAMAVVGIAAPAAADCPGGIENGTRVDLYLDWGERTIVVEPESAEIFVDAGEGRPGRVCWAVSGLQEGQVLRIGSKPGQPEHFPGADRTVRHPRDFANSGRPSAAGIWRYDVWVTEEGSDHPLLFVDPQIVIRPSGS